MGTDDTRRSDGQGFSEEEREALDEALWGGRIHDDVPFLVARIKADAYAAGLAARVSATPDTATEAEGPCDDPDCRSAVCSAPDWFAATREEERLIKVLSDHGIGQIHRRGEYDWDVSDVPVAALRDILRAAVVSSSPTPTTQQHPNPEGA